MNKKNKILNGKKILVTAGPTWVPIDRVRVITNIFSGRTGCIIAKKAKELGAKVKILLGPGRINFSNKPLKNIEITRFYYFDDLLKLIKQEILNNNYDILIHSAAIADYLVVGHKNNKIPSGKKNLCLRFKPAAKIIKMIKKWDPNIFLVQFKLEVNKKQKDLITIGYDSMIKNKADLVVVNDLSKMNKNNHQAFIIDPARNIIKVNNRSILANKLLRIAAKNIN